MNGASLGAIAIRSGRGHGCQLLCDCIELLLEGGKELIGGLVGGVVG